MRIKVLAIIALLAISMCFIPTGVAQAYSISPITGVVGTEVTVKELTENTIYSIFWDSALIKQATASSTGAVAFTVPAGYAGEHTVAIKLTSSGTTIYTTSFTIVPDITIDTISGATDTNITIVGHGFALNEKNINVTYDGTSIKSGITADEDGTWTTTFAVPASVKGKHAFDAYGDTTATSDVSNKYFTVSPSVEISPTTGSVGTIITVTASGFATSESGIKVLYSGKEVRTAITADTAGSWSTSFPVPNSIKGSHTISFEGNSTVSGDIADRVFTVVPTIVLSPTSGSVEDALKITGSGFANNESSIEVTWDSKSLESNIVADDNGSWTINVKIPASSEGAHAVGASGRITPSSDVVPVNFTIQSVLSVLPRNGNVGDEVRVTGSGFTTGKDFSITWDGTSVASGTVNESGTFQSLFKAPAGKSGLINIIATDSKGVTATTTFSMETAPPDVPQISSPKDGATVGFMGNTRITFKWSDVSDPSGVMYELQVSDKSSFSKPLVSRTKLNDITYTLTEAESLANGEYYWHIRAVDGAGNASDWSPTAMVKVGFITLTAIIWIVVAIVVLLIAVAIINRMLHKKKHHKKSSDWE